MTPADILDKILGACADANQPTEGVKLVEALAWHGYEITEPHVGWPSNQRRPPRREDGFPTRNSILHFTAAERAIYDAMHEVEKAGGSPQLTEAVTLLSKARARVADHIEQVA